MLPNILSDYLDRVEQAIQQCSNVDVERYEEEILTPTRANLIPILYEDALKCSPPQTPPRPQGGAND